MIDEDPTYCSTVAPIETKQALTLEDSDKGVGIILVGKSIPLHCQSNPYEL